MLEEKKIQSIRNREFIDRFLRENGISASIASNPRYQSILWRLSYSLMKMKVSPATDEAKEFLGNIVNIESDGSVTLMQSTDDIPMICSRYYIDKDDQCLKKVRVEFDSNGKEETRTISTYNEDGIEECLLTEQNVSEGKYFSKTERIKNRPDIIMISRVEQIGETRRLEDVYQSRLMWAALEDINPDIIDIDPFDKMNFPILGVPPIYTDVSYIEAEAIKNNKIFPLLQVEREKQFQYYKELNQNYSRTTAFEKGMAKLFIVKNRTKDED